MGPFAWRPPFPKALRGKETMTKRLSSSRTFIFLAGLVALTSVRMTVAAAAVHPDGYVEIRDRLKDVIISSGENISSVEVEGALLRHPAVQEVAIVGMPDERWGEAPHAFVSGIAQSATEGQTVRLPPVLMQPIVSDDVAAVMADAGLAEPLNGTVDLAGPEPIRQDDLVRRFLKATGDARTVITDPKALYYGIAVNDQSLMPGDNPRLGPTRFADWLSRNA